MKFTNEQIVKTVMGNYRKAVKIYQEAVDEDFAKRKAEASQFDPMPIVNGQIFTEEIRDNAENKIAALRSETTELLNSVYEDVKADQMEDPSPEAMRAIEAISLTGRYTTEKLFKAIRERYGDNFIICETLNGIGFQMHEQNPDFIFAPDDLGHDTVFSNLEKVQKDIDWHMRTSYMEKDDSLSSESGLFVLENELKTMFPYKDSGAAEGETATGAEA